MKPLLVTICVLPLLVLPAHKRCVAQTDSLTHPWRLDTAQAWVTTLSVKGADQYPLASMSADQREKFQTAFKEWVDGKSSETKPTLVDFEDLSSGLSERIKRAPSVKIEGVQASRYAYGVPYGSPAGTQSSFLSNPDTALFNYSATLNFSELFLSVADRTTACKSANALVAAGFKMHEKKEGSDWCNDYQFITGNRGRDFAERFFSGLSLTYTASQNAKVQKSLIQGDGDVTFSHSITGSFDPTKFWRTASDWEAAVGVYESQADIEGEGDKSSRDIDPVEKQSSPVPFHDFPCLDPSREGCFSDYAYGWKKIQILKALIPRVDVKAVTPLNFQSANNVFLSQPADERKVLYTVALSIDLTKFIPNSKSRASAANVLVALANTKDKRSAPKAAFEWRLKVKIYYVQLISDPHKVDDDTWWNEFQRVVQNPVM
jgi:hypothetical protein